MGLKKHFVVAIVMLLSAAQDLGAVGDIVKPSALDRRWVYLNPQGRLTDEAATGFHLKGDLRYVRCEAKSGDER